MARVSDGAIVGSAIVKIVAEHGENADQALFDYVQSYETSCPKGWRIIGLPYIIEATSKNRTYHHDRPHSYMQSITKMFIVVFLEVVCNAVHVVVKKGRMNKPSVYVVAGIWGPLGGPIYTNVHRQTGVTIVDFERYNMGYKDNFINTYLIQWTVISGRSSRETIGDLCLSLALLWALMYMVCALIGWANADDSIDLLLGYS